MDAPPTRSPPKASNGRHERPDADGALGGEDAPSAADVTTKAAVRWQARLLASQLADLDGFEEARARFHAARAESERGEVPSGEWAIVK